MHNSSQELCRRNTQKCISLTVLSSHCNLPLGLQSQGEKGGSELPNVAPPPAPPPPPDVKERGQVRGDLHSYNLWREQEGLRCEGGEGLFTSVIALPALLLLHSCSAFFTHASVTSQLLAREFSGLTRRDYRINSNSAIL